MPLFFLHKKSVHKNVFIAGCQNYGLEKFSQELYLSVHVTKSKQKLDDLDDDSTDIFKSKIIEHYSIRPDSISVLDKLCLAEFAAYYYKDYRKESDKTNDAQPNVLTDEVIHTQHSILQNISLPPQITLMNTKEKMKCRKVKAVIRYHTPNKTKEPECYFHHY